MTQKQETRWYIYPENDETNDAIYNTMRAMGEEVKKTVIHLKEGGLPVLESSSRFINYFTGCDKTGRNIKYKIFWEDKFGTIREWRLQEKSVQKRAKRNLRKRFLKTAAQKREMNKFPN